MFVPQRKHITSPLRTQQVNAIYRFLNMYINITITILDIIQRPFFYLKHKMDYVRTSQERYYVSATSPTGQWDLQISVDGILI
jgi:hypothetical protein